MPSHGPASTSQIRERGRARLIAGTDAHAKNYAVLIAPPLPGSPQTEEQVRLAPLYDVASALPYDIDSRKLKFAMKVGGRYLLDDIGLRQWIKLSGEIRISTDEMIDRWQEMARALPDAAAASRGKRKRTAWRSSARWSICSRSGPSAV